MAGAPTGNSNAARGKQWRDAVRKALIQGQKLDVIANKLIQMAEEGDLGAIKEIGDRLDGKPTQSIGGDEENPLNVISSIIVEHVKSTHSDT